MKARSNFPKILLLLLNIFLSVLSISGQTIATITSIPSCENKTSGTITVSLNPQLFEPEYDLPVHIEWVNTDNNDAGSKIQTGYLENITNLGPGNYIIEIELSNTCLLTSSTVVGSVNKVELQANILDATLNYCNNGAIDLTVNGGYGPYTYIWRANNLNFPGSSSQDINNLRNSTYCVTVTDAACGSSTACYDVICCPSLPTHSISYTCSPSGGYVGTIMLHWNVSPIPYDVLWFNSSGQQVLGTPTGIYNVPLDVYRAEFHKWDTECFFEKYYNFGISPLSIEIGSKGNISRCGYIQSYDGYASPLISGGASPYTLRWTGPNNFSYNGLAIGNIGTDGIYTATVTDANGCTASVSFNICCCRKVTHEEGGGPTMFELGNCFTNDDPISIVGNVTGATNGNNGSIELTVTGGSNNYTFLWDNGSHSEDLTNLSDGRYCVSVNDGCSIEVMCFAVGNCAEETFTVEGSVSDACISWSDKGEIDLTIHNNAPPYSYTWSNGITENSPNVSGLAPGEYCVTITNSVGCSVSECYNIKDIWNSDPPMLDFDAVLGPIGESRGAILLNVSGEEDYTYLWSNGFTTPNIYNLEQGLYSVTISNSIGCQLTEELFLFGVFCGVFPTPNLEAKIDHPTAQHGNYYSCDETGGVEGILIQEISSGWPPYTLTVEREISHEQYEVISTQYFDEAVYNYVIPDLPRDRYRVSVSDLCGKSPAPIIIDLCVHCGYEYDEDDEVITLFKENASSYGITLDLRCTCDDGCFLLFPRIDLDVNDLRVEDVTIAFPEETFIIYERYQNLNPNDRYYLNDDEIGGELFNIEVERGDGCEFTIPITWNEANQQNIIFHDDGFGLGGAGFVLSNGNIIDDYYFGNYKCEFCNPLMAGGIYSEDESDCVKNSESGVAIFLLDPPDDENGNDDYSNPCYNGGTISAYRLDNNGNAILDNQFYLPENLQPLEVITTPWVGKIGVSEVCEIGGGCVYNASDIFTDLEFELSKEILVTWCEDSYSVPDSDNDGIPDAYDPCPEVEGIDCDDPDFPPGGGADDCITEEEEGIDCVYDITCNGVTETLAGTYNGSTFGGFFPPLNCYFCLETEYCEIITSTGELIIEFIEDPVSHIIVTEDPTGAVCDPSYPNSCNVKIYCDENHDTYPQPAELIGTYCHPDCDGPEYLTPYLPLCSPPSYYYVLDGITLTGDQDSSEVRALYSLDKELLRAYIHEERSKELKKQLKIEVDLYKMYPNPISNYLILENHNESDHEVVIIIENIYGQQILKRNSKLEYIGYRELFNLNEIAPSYYLLKVYDLNGRQIFLDKFIKT